MASEEAKGASVEDKALKQMEFYFSDSNLPRDKFLLEQTKKNAEGWVPIHVIASFKRMKAITEDLEAVISAASKSAELLEVKGAGRDAMVRRRATLPDKAKELVVSRSIYAKGLPADSTIESLTTYFNQYGRVLSVRLRTYFAETVSSDGAAQGGRPKRERKFKGSAFVEFSSPEEALAVSKMELKVGETPLILRLMNEYLTSKRAEAKEGRGKNRRGQKPKGGADDEENDDDDDDEDAAQEPAAKKAKKAESTEEAAGDGADAGKEEKKEAKEEKPHTPDSLIHFSELKGASREDLKAVVEKHGGVVGYVDFSREQVAGYVRLRDGKAADVAAKIAAAAEETIAGNPFKCRALDPDEETKYWKDVADAKAARGGNKRKGKQGGRPQRNQPQRSKRQRR